MMDNVNKRDCKYIWLRKRISVIEHKYTELTVMLDPNTTRGEALAVMELMLSGLRPEEKAMARVVLTNGGIL